MYELIRRAMSALSVMDEETFAQILEDKGVDRGEAFLAIKAATCILQGETWKM